MAILLTCSCGNRLRTKEQNAGKRAKCPACGTNVTIPGSASVRQIPSSNGKQVNATHTPPDAEHPEWDGDLVPLS